MLTHRGAFWPAGKGALRVCTPLHLSPYLSPKVSLARCASRNWRLPMVRLVSEESQRSLAGGARAMLLGHKITNVLAKLPKSQQNAKRSAGDLDGRYESRRRSCAWVKFEKAAEYLNKDLDTPLTFFNFPAEHWKHLRTTNPSKARSQPCDTARPGQWDACRTAPRSPWSSISSKLHTKVGDAL
jgi:Transposase, Mutator family